MQLRPLSRRALAPVARALASASLIALALAACGSEQATDDLNPQTTTSSASSTPATNDDLGPPTTPAEPEARTIAVSFADGAVVGGVRTEVVPLDEPVRIEVSGDAEEEVHVHTYDLFGQVTPETPAVIELTADIPGIHEVELEGSHLTLLELQVEP